MKLLFHAVAARVSFRTQSLDPEHISSVWGEVANLDRAFLQNQDCVGGHVALAVVILQREN